jgi:predicted O-methyltransferase YrrM
MTPLSAHLGASRAALLAGFDAYREGLVLAGSDERFNAALSLAQPIEGFTTPGELSLLYHLALHAGSGNGRIVEIGSYLGRSTVVLARACADTGAPPVVAVDPHTAALGIEGRPPRDTKNDFLANIDQAGVANHVQLEHTTSVEAAKRWSGEPIRMEFVDGWHTREAVLEDVGSWAEWFTPDVCVVFDDFMVSDGVRRAVRELQAARVLPDRGVIVGKMAAYGPLDVLERLPVPPGGRLLGRLGPERFERVVKLAAR